jgi:hypothetical protein
VQETAAIYLANKICCTDKALCIDILSRWINQSWFRHYSGFFGRLWPSDIAEPPSGNAGKPFGLKEQLPDEQCPNSRTSTSPTCSWCLTWPASRSSNMQLSNSGLFSERSAVWFLGHNSTCVPYTVFLNFQVKLMQMQHSFKSAIRHCKLHLTCTTINTQPETIQRVVAVILTRLTQKIMTLQHLLTGSSTTCSSGWQWQVQALLDMPLYVNKTQDFQCYTWRYIHQPQGLKG